MLKRILFNGFKSFADKVEVDFSEGITAVIGPNGCGKSNIFDGVRWVLGEQSAKSLRGGKMDDVIFSGSDSRKAQNMAEVTLFLDNSTGIFKRDEQEVIITRKATRGKGSEYFINGEPSRMKDVHELFMDTGVGSNSYSIIGQGQIDRILSTKIEERRAIFEEASGIVKLKQRKEQTEKNLVAVDSNLLRIEDILKEIEKQLNPLREQSEKAKEFNGLSDSLKTIETQYLLHEYDNINVKIIEVKEVIDNLNKEVEKDTLFLEENEEKLKNLKSEFQIKNDDTFEFQKETASLKEEIQKIESSISLCDERISNSKNKILEFEDQLKEIEQKYSLSTEDYKDKQKQLENLELSIKSNEAELISLNTKIVEQENEKMSVSTEIDFLRNKTTEEYNELTKEKYELEQLAKKEEEANLFLNNVADKIEEATLIKNQVKEEFDSFNSIFQTKVESLDKASKKLMTQNEELTNYQDEYNSLINEQREVDSSLINAKNKHDLLENSFENNDSFFEGVKSILKAQKDGKISGIHGAIADLVSVHKNYELAVETLLASTMQFLVTEDDGVAKKAVQILKQEKLGKATFLPLNMASGNGFDKNDMQKISETKGISFALDVLDFDPKYHKIISGIIGRSLIAENLDVAVEFMKHSKIRAKISTMDGEVVQQGSISGGQNKRQKSSYFQKKTELEELSSKIDSLSSRQIVISKEKETISKKIEEIHNSNKQINLEIEKMKNDVYQDQLSFEELKLNLERKEEKLSEIELQEKDINLNLSSMRKALMNLRMSIEKTELNYQNSNNELNNLTSSLSELENSLSENNNKKLEFSVEITKLNEEYKSIKEFLEDFNNGTDSIEDKISKLYAKKDKELSSIETLSKNKDEFTLEYDKLYSSYKESDDKLQEMLSNNKTITEETEKLEEEIKNVRLEKEKAEKELNSKNVYVSKKETELSNITSKLFESYEIQEEEISILERLDIDISASKKEIDSIKRKMNGLGSINHQAIEDCEALEERYSKEKSQFDDVNSAKKDLSELLKSVEDEMTTKFNDTFTTISEHFKKIFVELFGGGKATLSLVDPKNCLTSAIEITAQPPGKKPQSINSLSGGEKAFTAVALIFSIISAKPSPFVIFDEVDAPLDDANVVRYAKYTKEYSKKCQFILVTHRKQCMQMANSLLGITQKVPGVSIMFPYAVEELDNIQEIS